MSLGPPLVRQAASFLSTDDPLQPPTKPRLKSTIFVQLLHHRDHATSALITSALPLLPSVPCPYTPLF